MSEKHAQLSPSSAHRWMFCPGSVVLEEGEPDDESSFALEGSFAHAVAAHCLENNLDAREVHEIVFRKKKQGVSSSMKEHVQEYLNVVRSKEGTLLVEQKLELEDFTKEKGATGTGDAIIVGDGCIEVVDLKYGVGVRVNAFENPQLMLYGVASARQFDMLGDYATITSTISQPRLNYTDSYTFTAEQAKEFKEKVRACADKVEEAKRSNSLEGYLFPEEKRCHFCKGAYKCPALTKVVVEATLCDFEDLTQTELVVAPDISRALQKASLVEVWLKKIRAKAEAKLFAGETVEGFKLIAGRRGARDWTDEGDVEALLRAHKVDPLLVYSSSLRTPTQIEKRVKNSEVLEALKKYITQKAGKPSIAPVDDPRPALVVDASADFEDLTKGE